jgi:hypothetical protein
MELPWAESEAVIRFCAAAVNIADFLLPALGPD